MMEENSKLMNVLDKLGEYANEYRGKDCFGFRPYENAPSSSQSAFGLPSTNDFKEFLHYKTMVNFNIFDMNTEVRNLPTNELEVVNNVIEEIRKKSLVGHIKNLALPIIYKAEDQKIEEIEEHTENKTCNYEVT
jgi:hypothetical protein